MDAVELTPLLTDWRSHRGPLHQRLATAVASLIDARLLRPGDRLPSERTLARRLAISRTTASAAYDLLRQRGDLHSVRGSGTTVAGNRTMRHDPSIATLAANPFIGHAHHQGPTGFVDLSVCRFDPPTVVTDALANSTDELLHIIGNGHYTAGLPALRYALAQTITAMGLPTLPSQLLITTGSQQGLALIASELERNDRVMIEDPTYFGAIHAYVDSRAKLIPLPVGHLERAGTMATRERRVDLIHVTSAVHNPTGRQLGPRPGNGSSSSPPSAGPRSWTTRLCGSSPTNHDRSSQRTTQPPTSSRSARSAKCSGLLCASDGCAPPRRPSPDSPPTRPRSTSPHRPSTKRSCFTAFPTSTRSPRTDATNSHTPEPTHGNGSPSNSRTGTTKATTTDPSSGFVPTSTTPTPFFTPRPGPVSVSPPARHSHRPTTGTRTFVLRSPPRTTRSTQRSNVSPSPAGVQTTPSTHTGLDCCRVPRRPPDACTIPAQDSATPGGSGRIRRTGRTTAPDVSRSNGLEGTSWTGL